MSGIETNVFPITNLAELSSEYRLYRVKGLNPDQTEYYLNRENLKRRLSFLLKKPVTVIDREGVPHVVVRADAGELPSPYPLVRVAVQFERVSDRLSLNYTERSPENDEICLRFLQFTLQEPLRSNQDLWQPGAGQPFFKKRAEYTTPNLLVYRGYAVRAVVTPEGGLGLCVDVVSKYVSKRPLPLHISRDDLKRWKGRHCIYHYGHLWYEIQVSGLDDRNVSDYFFMRGTRLVSLLDDVSAQSEKPLSPEVASLAHDASVVLYKDNRKEDRGAPSTLCYPVYSLQDEEAKRIHDRTQLVPYQRRGAIHDFVRGYLRRLRFGDTRLLVSDAPVVIPQQMFTVPDLRFGHSKILSVRGTPGAQHVGLDNLGATRLALLKDKDVGFYQRDPLQRQYFIMPLSVAESYGGQYLKDQRRIVNDLFPQEEQDYDPILVTYNDRGPRTYPYQGKAILQAVAAECTKPGNAVVMIHPTTDRLPGKEDQLEAMVVRELREYGIYSAVIHTVVGQECYEHFRGRDGAHGYRMREDKRGKLMGYLRGVALSKILLTNERWPFVLATKLHADLAIGVDVKHNTAGIVVVGRGGAEVRWLPKKSKQKERLLEEQMQAYLMEIIRLEAPDRSEPIRVIALHRDGRLWQSELKGARAAIKALKDEGTLPQDAQLTIIEIPKTSPAPLRLFESINKNGRRNWIENPQVGSYMILNESDGYLCPTGRPFLRNGTVRPLHIRHIEGPLTLEKCMEDYYYLTVLAWTKPDDCTRDAITIKLNDRYLGEEATEYNADVLDITATVGDEEVA